LGGETPFVVSGDGEKLRIDSKRRGTTIQLLPAVQPDGRIQLEVRGQVSENGATNAQVTAMLRDGQTMVMNGESLRTKDNFHRLIIVTPHLVRSADAAKSATPPIVAKSCQSMTLTDVVQLCKRGISDDIVIRQMEIMGATFNLSVDDILELNQHGVSDDVIRAMQNRRQTPVSPNWSNGLQGPSFIF
jgi:hypothetical protein